MKFTYKALKPGGEEIIGDIEAISERIAKAEIRQCGLYPVEIYLSKSASPKNKTTPQRKKEFITHWGVAVLIGVIAITFGYSMSSKSCGREKGREATEFSAVATRNRIGDDVNHDSQASRGTLQPKVIKDGRLSGNRIGDDVNHDSQTSRGTLQPKGIKDGTVYWGLRNKEDSLLVTDIICNRYAVKDGSLEGKVILLNFWGLHCSPCIESLGKLEKIWQNYKDDGLIMIGLHYNGGNLSLIEKLIKDNKITYPITMDFKGNKIAKSNGVFMIPEYFLFKKKGDKYSYHLSLHNEKAEKLLRTAIEYNLKND